MIGAALATALLAGALVGAAAANAANAAPFTVVGDGIPEPLTTTPGDAERGRAVVVDRQTGLCLLCHRGPFDRTPLERQQGTLASDLAGAGSRWSAAQLRLRIVDSKRLDPGSIMPAYHRVEGLNRVGRAWAGRPVLGAQQVEDVVAFLLTLK